MADGWNLINIEPLDDKNYFLWREKIEGVLRAKKLWKKVIGVKPPDKPNEEEENYHEKFRKWDEWDDNNHAARTIMINTMSKAQVLKYCNEKCADKLWDLIRYNMAAESEQVKAKALSELTNLRMKKEESVDDFLNRAEALKNQCEQLGKLIEDFELRMYVLRGLRQEFDQNVRILENQRETNLNDIRYALKQEEVRRERRKDEKIQKDQESVRKVKEKLKSEISCYNCGKRGHKSSECYAKQKCFNCQGYGHISKECKKVKSHKYVQSKGKTYKKGEVMMNTADEAVMTVIDRVNKDTTQRNRQEEIDYESVKEITWLLDSGSTSHMTSDEKVFDKKKSEEREITLADKEGRKLTSNAVGEIVMKQDEIKTRVRLKNVLCVPDLSTNLLSVAKFTDCGYVVKFDKRGAEIYKEGEDSQMIAERRGNAYYVEAFTKDREAVTLTTDDDVWHRRLGHVNKKTIEDMNKEKLVVGMKEKDQISKQCESCVEGKACRKVHVRMKERKTKNIMELWHIDLIGPISPKSKGGKRYVFTIVDDYSRMLFVLLLKKKREAAEELKNLIVFEENQTRIKLKGIRSDNGGEFIGTDLKIWLQNKGIKHELSPARTPQCNGVAERGNRSIIEMTRSLMSDSRLPANFWAEAVCTATHIKIRVKSTVHGRTPYELWYGRVPNVKYMKRFGCIAYTLNKKGSTHKFGPKTEKGIFIGYGKNNTYRVYIPQKEKVKNECDVKFDESRNGVELLNNNETEFNKNTNNMIVIGIDDEENIKNLLINEDDQDGIENELYNNETEEEENETQEDNMEDRTDSSDSSIYEDTIEKNYEEDVVQERNMNKPMVISEQPIQTKSRGRPKGTTNEVLRLRRQTEKDVEKQRIEGVEVRRSERIKNRHSTMLTVDKEIPKDTEHAKKTENWKNWKQAMNEEMDAMMKHKVWEVVPRPKEQRVIKCKWVYNIKEDPTTGEKKYKARLVAMGCGQRPGYDYTETFAPVIRLETIRILFSIAARERKRVKLYDVKTAFLHGDLTEEIYMEMPKGYETRNNHVCRLQKSIYGLKQAGRCWNEYLTNVLIKCGLVQCKEDPCLFYTRKDNNYLYCGVHVDDMIIISSNEEFEQNCMKDISKEIDMKNLGEASTILGMQLEQNNGRIEVHLEEYIKKLLEMYGMEECNSAVTPIDINVKMENDGDSEDCNKEEYQELVGRLMYLSVHGRPDISYAITCLSQFNKNPKIMHMAALKRILRYLKGTINYRLIYESKRCGQEIKCEADASWDSTRDAKSFTGLLIYMNGDLVNWRSKKQAIVALSSTESELEAVLDGVKELTWTSNLLTEIGLGENLSRVIECDNLNTVRLANGGSYRCKSKLLNRKSWYIREAVIKENIRVFHVASGVMTADCLTKALSGPGLLKNVKKILKITSQ